MTISSVRFLLFLAAVCLLYFAAPQRFRGLVLLIANYIFYALWQPAFGLLLLLGTAISYGCALATDKELLGRRRLWTALGVCYLIGVLFVYKYLDFFCVSILSLTGFESGLVLPIGISFYTFSAAGYLFDVYRKKCAAERNFVCLAAALSFFPSILSGPINRMRELLPQLKAPQGFSYERMKHGLFRFAVGAVKKLVLADTLAVFVNTAYGDIASFSGGNLLIAAVFYSLQIYFDFAGYSDMAIGAAEILGFKLGENFNAPYLTRSVKEFWKNWHISLTSWFREYLYFPMGGSRKGKCRTYLNVMTVFAVSGLWHGADMSFMLWGALNGAYQVVGQMTDACRKALRKRLHISEDSKVLALIQGLFSFALITAAWVFFRADGLGDAVFVLKRIALILRDGWGVQAITALGSVRQLVLVLLLTAVFTLADYLSLKGKSYDGIEKTSFRYWIALSLMAAFIFVFGVYGDGFDAQSFVYFRF